MYSLFSFFLFSVIFLSGVCKIFCCLILSLYSFLFATSSAEMFSFARSSVVSFIKIVFIIPLSTILQIFLASPLSSILRICKNVARLLFNVSVIVSLFLYRYDDVGLFSTSFLCKPPRRFFFPVFQYP